jgi:hypothetical protein
MEISWPVFDETVLWTEGTEYVTMIDASKVFIEVMKYQNWTIFVN